ncbi:putative extracellular glycine/serine-rich protein [Aspergillus fumigatus Af293]|uniref:Extracellular glycine/serine-rich protein, putative n=2 Tax=Aspergillus fumigatus TaxID=746128 RepID=Q4WLC1_ASPFU|nr:extracellular glycine/serine-rich protein, putative [Aspergillus fumigatus Af293]EAL89243.1 extracellular glycine/serine-rich protein, putative [Aspergillus fumigatus Af293]EDP55377.1 hypothetical protein AFUB_000670 [Aspergillus fumigatus A1163]
MATQRKAKASLLDLIFLVDMISFSSLVGARPLPWTSTGASGSDTAASSGTPTSWGGSGGSSFASASPGIKVSGSWAPGNAGEVSDTGTKANSSGFSSSSSGSSAMAGFGVGSEDAASKGSARSNNGTTGAGTGDAGYGSDVLRRFPAVVEHLPRPDQQNAERPKGPTTMYLHIPRDRLKPTRSVGGGNTSNGVNGGATNTGSGTNVNVITSPANGGEKRKGQRDHQYASRQAGLIIKALR